MVDSRNWFASVPASRRRHLIASRRDGVGIDVDGQHLINFASNDYLGLSNHPALSDAAQSALANGVGSGASRLVSGDDPALHRLEQKLADWKGYEACLIVGSGMLANIGLIQALANRHSHIFADKLNHASLVDGTRLSGAHSHRFQHRNTAQLESLLQQHPAERRIIISDGVFSMDGDCADVSALLQLAETHDTLLLIDDAHGIGSMGADGKGLTAQANISGHSRLLEVGTFGKAFGSYGAFILASKPLIEGLKQHQRSMIYSTALPLAMISAADAALDLIQDGSALTRLHANITHFKQQTTELPFMPSKTAIQPLLIGSDTDAVAMAMQLRECGFFVPAIRPPTVPEHTARLRFTLSAAHTTEQIVQLSDHLSSILANVCSNKAIHSQSLDQQRST